MGIKQACTNGVRREAEHFTLLQTVLSKFGVSLIKSSQNVKNKTHTKII